MGLGTMSDLVEQQFGEDFHLNEYTEYDEEALSDLFIVLKDKMDAAKKSGLTRVFVQFRSTLEPYEDCTCGPVEVQVRGYRGCTYEEKVEAEEQKRTQTLANKLGVSFYEAAVVDRLEKLNKVAIK